MQRFDLIEKLKPPVGKWWTQRRVAMTEWCIVRLPRVDRGYSWKNGVLRP